MMGMEAGGGAEEAWEGKGEGDCHKEYRGGGGRVNRHR